MVLIAGGIGVIMLLNRAGDDFAVGSCVKKSGTSAIAATCSEKDAFKVVTKVRQQSNCPDQNQPYLVIQRDEGKNDVLCLRPADED